ncbi:MAG TPA: UDP-N-acetylglucosamine-peptide N-acetylglucosaminyltransferase, partial [Casimicrobiaceae bacterium]|nr:UDP-N-acetylglucosamine-peptide N-acetylglucosaminyltransferase [Casimicrobiaceae bacterium]
RVGASLCAAAGLGDLVAESFAAYTATLAQLCSDRERLAVYKRRLEGERSRLPLFDTATFAGAFERMLEAVA